MQEGIHPEYYPVVFIDVSTGDEVVTKSTKKTGETKAIVGVDHYIIKCDITSFTHPYYTGTQRLVDTAGRVERFKRKYGKK
jgi:large subunit ribosomal protein L31